MIAKCGLDSTTNPRGTCIRDRGSRRAASAGGGRQAPGVRRTAGRASGRAASAGGGQRVPDRGGGGECRRRAAGGGRRVPAAGGECRIGAAAAAKTPDWTI